MGSKKIFDPDDLVLAKSEILEFCDNVIEKWDKNAVNPNHVLAMNAVKTSVLWTDDESLKDIWKKTISWTFELLYQNAMANNDEE